MVKNLTKEQRVFRLAAKLWLASLCSTILDKFTAEYLQITDEQYDIFQDELKNVADELRRGIDTADGIRGNIQIARKYIEKTV